MKDACPPPEVDVRPVRDDRRLACPPLRTQYKNESNVQTMQTLALNFVSLAHARAFRDAVDKYVKQCTKAKSKERVQLLPFFAVKLTSSDGVAVAAKVTALFNKTRSRAKGRHVGETVPETLSTLFGGSSPRGAPVRAAFLSLVGAAKLSAAVAFLNLPSSGVTTYMPANLNHSSAVMTTVVSALYKREFPCPPRRHDEAAHLAALPAMAAMAAALASDCTAFVPLPGFQALFAALHGRAPTDGERAVARGVAEGVCPVFFQEAVQPGLPLLHERRATGSLGRAVDGRVDDVRPLA